MVDMMGFSVSDGVLDLDGAKVYRRPAKWDQTLPGPQFAKSEFWAKQRDKLLIKVRRHRLETPAMERFTRERLMELATARRFPSISLYMPISSCGALRGVAEDITRFNSLAVAAEQLLVARGVRQLIAKGTMDSLRRRIEYELSWRETQRGLAVFANPCGSRIFCLCESLPERVIVGDRFYLKPLLSCLERRFCFYLLAATEESVRIFTGDQFNLAEVDLPGLPVKFPANYRARARVQAGLEAYFRAVDRALSATLSRTSVPLIFAGPSHLFPLYRSINSHAYLLGECIPGNPDLHSHEELRKRACSLAVPFYARSREMALAQFDRLRGTGRASNNLHELVWTARAGVVESLLVASDGDHWGIIDYDRRAVQPAAPTDPRAEELLDYVAVHTFLNRGAVYFLNRSQLPGGELAAAVYRDSPAEVENASRIPLASDQRPQTIGFQAVHS
jgi:hypothetical protein